MADEPTQQSPAQPIEPPEEKTEEKKEDPTPAEPENPNPFVPPESSTPSIQETPTETSPPPAEEQPKTPEPQPENPPQQPQSPKTEETKPVEEQKPEEMKSPEEKPQPPEPEIKVIDIEEKIQERLKTEQDERRKLANEARAKKKENNLSRILEFSKEKKLFSNDDIRDLLHVSQSTATNYLSELTKRGSIKREGKRGGAKYSR